MNWFKKMLVVVFWVIVVVGSAGYYMHHMRYIDTLYEHYNAHFPKKRVDFKEKVWPNTFEHLHKRTE